MKASTKALAAKLLYEITGESRRWNGALTDLKTVDFVKNLQKVVGGLGSTGAGNFRFAASPFIGARRQKIIDGKAIHKLISGQGDSGKRKFVRRK